VLARWPVTCTTNFPMALDEAHHRLFVGCRIPARLAVFDTETAKIVASPTIVEHTDDLFFDASTGRIYILGEGFIEAWQQTDPNHYVRIGRYPTPADGRTGLFVPELEELFETIPHHGEQAAEILAYKIRGKLKIRNHKRSPSRSSRTTIRNSILSKRHRWSHFPQVIHQHGSVAKRRKKQRSRQRHKPSCEVALALSLDCVCQAPSHAVARVP
jgi:hypothetical protein